MFCGVKKRGKTKNSFLFRSSFFLKSHPTLLFMVLAGCFLLIPGVQFAQAGWFENLTSPTAWINALIYPFFLFFSWIVNLAAGIFVWVINAETFTKLMNAGAIYEVWLIVRDFLNIFFILVLLFSAFATIFQLDKYEYKRTIPMLVIMALLVNFSFPVARFVIDLANVPMYFFSQNIFGVDGPNEITSGILSGTKMQNILIPGVDNNKDLKDFETTHLLAATICMFLFGISFLVLAILMLVRMIALAILVMFSPIGFVGMITPALQSFAKGWWDKLFKWAFYGPIAVMFVLVSVIVMKSAGDSIYPSAGAGGVFQSTGSSVNDNMVSAVAFFTIPIVLFWIAITSTEKYSNDISGLGIKWGSQLGRKAGNLARRGVVGTALYIPRQSGVVGGIENAWKNRRSWWLGGRESKEARERREAGLEGLLGSASHPIKGMRKALDENTRKRVHELAEKNKKDNRSYADLQRDLESKDEIKKRAAAITMADKEMFESAEDFSKALEAAGGDIDSITKIVRKAPKEMLRSGDDLAKVLEAVNTATSRIPGVRPVAQAQIKSQLIDKAGSGALPSADAIGGDQYRKILKSLGGDSTLEKTLESKMKKEGRLRAVLEYRLGEAGTDTTKRQLAYETTFGKLDSENLGKQGGLIGDLGFRDYFKGRMKSGEYNDDFLEGYLRYTGGGNRKSFENHVTSP